MVSFRCDGTSNVTVVKTIKIKGKFIGRDKVISNGFIAVVMQWYREQILHWWYALCSEYASKFIPNEWLIEGHAEYGYHL